MTSLRAAHPFGPRRTASLALAALTTLSLLAVPGTASAQFWKQLGFGANLGVTAPIDDEVDGAVVIGFNGGMMPEHGWGFAASLGWFEADVFDGRGAGSRRVGTLKVRPIMAGASYTWMRGRVAVTAALTTGVSVNDAVLDDALARAPVSGGQPFAIDVANSFAIRPALEVEYFLTRKFALTGSAGYLFTRPEIVLTTPAGRISDRWDASSFNVAAGFVVYPFR